MARAKKNPATTPANENVARIIELYRLNADVETDESGENVFTFRKLEIVAPAQIIDAVTARQYIQYYINLADLDKANKKLASLVNRKSKTTEEEEIIQLAEEIATLTATIDAFKTATADKVLKPATAGGRDDLLSKAIAYTLVNAGIYASFEPLYKDMVTYYDNYLDIDENHQHQRNELRDKLTAWADMYISGGATETYAEIKSTHLNHQQFLDIVTLARNTATISKKGWYNKRDKRDTVARRVLYTMLVIRMGCVVVTESNGQNAELMM